MLVSPADEFERLHAVREARAVFVVVARPITSPSMTEFLAVYSTRERAESFINAQDESRRGCLEVWLVELDRHPPDPFWARPEGALS
jgi:hypothetical protein